VINILAISINFLSSTQPHHPNARDEDRSRYALALLDQFPSFLLKRLDSVGSGRPAERRIVLPDELHQRICKFCRIAALLSADPFPRRDRFFRLLGVVADRWNGYSVESSVSSSVRKNPGSTSIVRIPNGSTSGARHSIHPSSPNFEAEYAETKG
jgi:hypothetical protein